jgi:hypothetical protein
VKDRHGVFHERFGCRRVSRNFLDVDLELNEAVRFHLDRMIVDQLRDAFGLVAVTFQQQRVEVHLVLVECKNVGFRGIPAGLVVPSEDLASPRQEPLPQDLRRVKRSIP